MAAMMPVVTISALRTMSLVVVVTLIVFLVVFLLRKMGKLSALLFLILLLVIPLEAIAFGVIAYLAAPLEAPYEMVPYAMAGFIVLAILFTVTELIREYAQR